MATKIEKQLEAYQGNVYPAMLNDLAAHLNVRADALAKLDLGWAPIVEFKKGKNYQGWWVIPERDATGKVVGLALRSQKDFKVMYPGSKHGFTYPVNPEHEAGQAAYKPGAHNWMRTMDAEVDCPVCGKPDGCLVHADDPDHPQAAVCIRTTSKKKLRFGYLHVLKDQGNFDNSTPLEPTDDYVIVVEGMTDAAAAMGLGFVAVGRPSNLAGMEQLRDLLRGRKVIVIGENDKKPDGSEPGKEGMIAAFQVLRTVCKDLKKVMPPEKFKDLRQWIAAGLNRDQLLEYVAANGDEKYDQVVIEDDRPRTIADRFLRDTYRLAGRWTVRYWKGAWFQWNGAKYHEIDGEIIRHKLYEWAHDKYVMSRKQNGEDDLQRIDATKHWVTNVEDAMRSITAIYAEDTPCWLTGKPVVSRYLVFTNGIMDLNNYLAGADFSAYMRAPNPDFFNLVAMPFAFDPTEECPDWRKFLFSSIGDETGKIPLLQEYFGYIISGDNRFGKFLVMRGVPASGKSTIASVAMQLVGPDQSTETKLSTLGDTYGLENLFGTMLATITEMKMPRTHVAEQSFETLLQVTGGDPVSINRKYKPILKTVRLQTRFLVSCNELPPFADHSGALKRRMMVLEFGRSFANNPDISLQSRLIKELPGICVWALAGLRRLHQQGYFSEPESTKEALKLWTDDANPVSSFVDDCIEFEDGACLSDLDAYDAFKLWCDERGRSPMALTRFRSFFVDATPSTVYRDKRRHPSTGKKMVTLENCCFAPWVEREYLSRR